MKQSEPRTDSSSEMEISPSLKVATLHFPKGRSSCSAIWRASSGFALPEKILMSLPCKFMSVPLSEYCPGKWGSHRVFPFIMTAEKRIYKVLAEKFCGSMWRNGFFGNFGKTMETKGERKWKTMCVFHEI